MPAKRPLTPAGNIVQFYNCKVLRNHELVEDYLYIQDGRIIDPRHMFWGKQVTPDITIDCEGCIISPGYIDVQLNGAFGYDFTSDSDCAAKAADVISKGLLLQGVTSYCPTLVSSEADVYEKVVPHLGPRKGDIHNGAEILGAHLEGPFISPQKKGAHEVTTFTSAPKGLSDFTDRYGLKNLKEKVAYITVAPEVEGIMDSIEQIKRETGIKVSVGHSMATVSQAEEACRRGCTLITHLFNAQPTFHQRDPGVVGMLGSSEHRPYYGIICDGIHVHPNSIKIAYNAHPKGAILVTDAMAAQGLPDGAYKLGQLDVEVTNGKVVLTGTDTIAGSVATMDECVRNFVKFTGASKVEALENATLHPAEALGIADRKGTLNFGADADFLLLDDDLNVKRVFIDGEEVKPEELKFTPRTHQSVPETP
ncbi:N-acetyl-glucosamine-6-phosphate deacetylase [Mycoemilia scoparia]|uniref:N-acetylglucosamine-6-phosphate deacetylase n=1 Tax=Mycoemilia scoparia TaxID=417184 RepID=A0A9W7ZTB6_9FUNG|nr:N-acetyl-glucosamine-6-phosphate deacetylase [Mycoemilia scoparia]